MAMTFRRVLMLLAFAAGASALENAEAVKEKEVNPTFRQGFLQKSTYGYGVPAYRTY